MKKINPCIFCSKRNIVCNGECEPNEEINKYEMFFHYVKGLLDNPTIGCKEIVEKIKEYEFE